MVSRYCCVPGYKTGYGSQSKLARAEGKPVPSIFMLPRAEPVNKATRRNNYESDKQENFLEDGFERSAKKTMENTLKGVTQTSAYETGTNDQQDERNDRAENLKVDQSRTEIPILITNVRSIDNIGSLGEESKGLNSPGLKILKYQGITNERVKVGRLKNLVKFRPKLVEEIHFLKEVLLQSCCSGKETRFMGRREQEFKSCLKERNKEETTTAGGRFLKRNYQEDNEDIENFRTKRQRQDTGSISEELPQTVENSIMKRLDVMNRNIEINTYALNTLSKTISDSSKENVRALNSLTAAMMKVGRDTL